MTEKETETRMLFDLVLAFEKVLLSLTGGNFSEWMDGWRSTLLQAH